MKKISSNFSLKTLGLVASLCLISLQVSASCIYHDFNGWKDCFVKEKLSTNINSVDVEVFQAAQFTPGVIELDKKQPERKLTFDQYLNAIDIDKKIQDGREFYNQHIDILNKVSRQYNVEPEIIVALIGIESKYGTIMGKFNVIDSLATLSFEGRRKEFFEKELINVLKIARNENLDYEDFKGSWAGAMGQTQFMPSSYLAYAVDYDGDGKADIWNSTDDAIASAANYLKSNGWHTGYSSIREVINYNDFKQCNPDVSQICKLDLDNRLIYLKDGVNMPVFEVGKNFEVLMKWNRSIYFGLSVLMIAKEIKTDL